MSGVDAFRWEDDDELLAELGEAVRAGDRVPETFISAGKGAYSWRTVEAELAELTADSADPASGELAGAGLRSRASAPRSLSFESSELTIELEVHADALRGQLVPPQPGSVQVRTDDDSTHAYPVDEVGWFVISPRPIGSIRLHVRTDDGASVRTDRFTV